VKRHEEFVKNMSLLKKNWGMHDAVGLGIISLENAVQPVKSLHNPTGKNISLKIHYMLSVLFFFQNPIPKTVIMTFVNVCLACLYPIKA
jgi:hypothetical protein